MDVKIARIISYLIHPLFIPTFLILIFFNINIYEVLLIPFEARMIIIGLVFLTTSVFPFLFILFMKQRGMINSLQLETKEERTYPFIVTGIFNLTAFYMLKQIQIAEIFYLFLLGSAILIIICLIVNFYFKISIHMAGLGGATGTLTGISLRLNLDLTMLIIIVILISGIVGYSRLRLNAHKENHVYVGYLCGWIVMVFILLL
jgi:hypothetical protein